MRRFDFGDGNLGIVQRNRDCLLLMLLRATIDGYESLDEPASGVAVEMVSVEVCARLWTHSRKHPKTENFTLKDRTGTYTARRRVDGLLHIVNGPEQKPPNRGPGTELKRLLSWGGIYASTKCQCGEIARKMDEGGPDWCRENMQTIIGSMESESKKRGIPFSKILAIAMVESAILKSRIH